MKKKLETLLGTYSIARKNKKMQLAAKNKGNYAAASHCFENHVLNILDYYNNKYKR